MTEAAPPMIILRKIKDLRTYYATRWTEWFMAVPALLMALSLFLQPDMFELAPQYTALESWADEGFWRNLLALGVTMRLVAAVTRLDSDFRKFCPFLRFGAAVIGVYVFGEFAAGFLATHNGPQGPIALGLLVGPVSLTAIEGRNLYKSAIDIGLYIQGKGDKP